MDKLRIESSQQAENFPTILKCGNKGKSIIFQSGQTSHGSMGSMTHEKKLLHQLSCPVSYSWQCLLNLQEHYARDASGGDGGVVVVVLLIAYCSEDNIRQTSSLKRKSTIKVVVYYH